MWNENERIDVGDIEEFCGLMRALSYFDVLVTSGDIELTDGEKEKLINQKMEEESDLITSDDLEEILSLDEVIECVANKIKVDPITNEEYINADDAMEIEREMAVKVLFNSFAELEKLGYANLCWDADKKDFVYEPTELGKKFGKKFEKENED